MHLSTKRHSPNNSGIRSCAVYWHDFEHQTDQGATIMAVDMVDPDSPYIHQDTLDNICANENKFGELVYCEFDRDAEYALLEPNYSDDMLHDAYQSYVWDVKRLKGNMGSKPDHFKVCGFLAYWLRRNSPVIGWNEIEQDGEINASIHKGRELIYEYGRAHHAFMIGYRICYFFERNKKTQNQFINTPPDEAYLRTVYYVMKYKHVSPHAMGLMYRSLFFV